MIHSLSTEGWPFSAFFTASCALLLPFLCTCFVCCALADLEHRVYPVQPRERRQPSRPSQQTHRHRHGLRAPCLHPAGNTNLAYYLVILLSRHLVFHVFLFLSCLVSSYLIWTTLAYLVLSCLVLPCLLWPFPCCVIWSYTWHYIYFVLLYTGAYAVICYVALFCYVTLNEGERARDRPDLFQRPPHEAFWMSVPLLQLMNAWYLYCCTTVVLSCYQQFLFTRATLPLSLLSITLPSCPVHCHIAYFCVRNAITQVQL